MLKRKREHQDAIGRNRKIHKTTVPRSGKGFLRNTGYYGRFAGTGGRRGPVEMKFKDTQQNLTAIGAALSNKVYPSMNLVDLGSGESQMIGRKLIIRRIYVSFNIQLTSQTSGTAAIPGNIADIGCCQPYRVSLVQDKQSNGTLPSTTDIYQSGRYDSARNLSNIDRFKILHTWTGTLTAPNVLVIPRTNNPPAPPVVNYTNVQAERTFTCYKKTYIPIEFSNITPRTQATVRTNNVFLMIQTRDTGSANVRFYTRIRYNDA